MVEKLNELGFAVDLARVLEIAQGGALGRPHLAQALFEKGTSEATTRRSTRSSRRTRRPTWRASGSTRSRPSRSCESTAAFPRSRIRLR